MVQLGLFSKSNPLIYENIIAFDIPCFCKIFKALKKLYFFPELHETRNVYYILTCRYFNWWAPRFLAETTTCDETKKNCSEYLSVGLELPKWQEKETSVALRKSTFYKKSLTDSRVWTARGFSDSCHLQTLRRCDSAYPPYHLI